MCIGLRLSLRGQRNAPVAEFYRVVLADPSAAEFLTTEQVERQLQEALRRWLIDVLSCRVEQVEEQMRAQQRAADVHARIGISVDLVEMGFRVLKSCCYLSLLPAPIRLR